MKNHRTSQKCSRLVHIVIQYLAESSRANARTVKKNLCVVVVVVMIVQEHDMGDVYICAVTQIKHQMYCEYFFQLQKNLSDYLYIR